MVLTLTPIWNECKAENLQEAAAYADDYVLTHKSTFIKNRSPVENLY